MIDIISLEKVLIGFIKLLDDKQLEKFKKNIFKTLNFKNKNNPESGFPNKKDNICNHPRTKNRGPCKRRCINNYCFYHEKKNTPKEYNDKLNNIHVISSIPDELNLSDFKIENSEKYNKLLPYEEYKIIKTKRRCIFLDNIFNNFQINPHDPCSIPSNNNSENRFLPQLIEYNDSSEIDQYDKNIFPNLNINVKIKNNKCIFVDDPCDFHVIPYDSDKKILPVEIENTEINKKVKKKKKKKPRYIKEYNILCSFYEFQIKTKIYKYNICIKTKLLLNNILDYEKNKTKNKDEISNILSCSINIIGKNEDLDKSHIDIMHLISYIYTLADVIKSGNYDNKDFKEVKIYNNILVK